MSTISNDRLQQLSSRLNKFIVENEIPLSDELGKIVDDTLLASTELLALRKEREKVDPVAWLICGSKTFKDRTASTREVAEQAVKDRKDGSSIKPLYTAPPAAAHVDEIAAQAGIDPAIADAYMQGCHDTEARKAETDTTSQQFESLAGKAVVPAGWKLVPIELTKEMLKQIHPFAEATCLDCGNQVVAHCVDNVTASWNDMLAVAPEPCK
ncbi:hypothetical protein SMC44_002687 [Cronobacter malonaticus]|nr:hypothetical protein [Cronobacter malonaticus]